MFFAAGVGAYQAAMFHLFTHAFFKALLFLGAGSVIHGMHHEQDMRRYGALAKYLPVTYAVMTIGTIAITGLGIPALESASPASIPRTPSSTPPTPAGRRAADRLFRLRHRRAGRRPDRLLFLARGLLHLQRPRPLGPRRPWRTTAATHAHAAHDDHASQAQIETHAEPLHDDHARRPRPRPRPQAAREPLDHAGAAGRAVDRRDRAPASSSTSSSSARSRPSSGAARSSPPPNNHVLARTRAAGG